MADNFLTRNRKLNPETMFLSVLALVTSTNREGYSFALQKAWDCLDKNVYQTPAKSSFSEAREKLSFEFFKDAFEDDLTRFRKGRKTYRGYDINAVDGSDLDLPASDDVLKGGYHGSMWSKEFETYYPKMHVVHAYDVVNGTVSIFKHSTKNSERALTREIAFDFSKKSLTIYDRLYCGHPTFKSHIEAGNLFLVRALTRGPHLPVCVREFLASSKVDQVATWIPNKLRRSEALEVRLIKITHPKTKEISVFVTNAPQRVFSRLELGKFYLKRWEIESSFKDLVATMKMDQWHSTKINGILQEIYCLLWITNAVKMQMQSVNAADDILAIDYIKSNFKLCMQFVMNNLKLLLRANQKRFFDLLEYWIIKTREKRRHRSRSYPRVVRSYGTGFNVDNKVPRASRCA